MIDSNFKPMEMKQFILRLLKKLGTCVLLLVQRFSKKYIYIMVM
jgi:hypothetical protein